MFSLYFMLFATFLEWGGGGKNQVWVPGFTVITLAYIYYECIYLVMHVVGGKKDSFYT